jgi:hypothetical protein
MAKIGTSISQRFIDITFSSIRVARSLCPDERELKARAPASGKGERRPPSIRRAFQAQIEVGLYNNAWIGDLDTCASAADAAGSVSGAAYKDGLSVQMITRRSRRRLAIMVGTIDTSVMKALLPP